MKMKTLMEFCDLNMGQSPKSETYNEENIGLPFFQGNADFGEVYPKVRIWCSSPVKVAAVGDILISVRAPIGAMNIANTPCCIGRGLAALSPNPDTCMREYLYYALQSRIDWLIAQGTGSTFKAIGRKTLEGTQIPAYSLDEQQIISDTLSKTDQLITKAKAQVSLLDELVKSRFSELFGERGKRVPLKDYVWFQEGPGVRSVDFTSDGTILLTGSNINDNQITFGHKSDRFVSNELAKGRYSHFMCDIDDILVVSSAIDPSKFDKKVTIVQKDKKYCLNTGIIRFKPNREYLTLSYFREFLKTDYFKHQVMEEMRGIAQMHFGPSHLKEMTILLPESLEDQVEFERFVSQVDKSKLAVKQSLEKLETLKKSLMQQYFG